jgi:GTP-binding nuclear protein Ran
MAQTYKVIIVGNRGVGKSSFVYQRLRGGFNPKYNPTCGVDTNSLTFYSQKGKRITFNVCECSPTIQSEAKYNTNYIGANCAIVMYDCCSKLSLRHVDIWIEDIKKVVGNIPIVICGNKSDVAAKQYFYQGMYPHFTVSAKNNVNFELPFVYLTRALTSKHDTQFLPYSVAR